MKKPNKKQRYVTYKSIYERISSDGSAPWFICHELARKMERVFRTQWSLINEEQIFKFFPEFAEFEPATRVNLASTNGGWFPQEPHQGERLLCLAFCMEMIINPL